MPLGIVAVGSHLYWTNNAQNTARAGSVWAAGLDGTSAHAIVTGQNAPLGVAADGSHLYWANVLDQAIEQANPDGSSPHAIVTGQNAPLGVAADGSHLYWANVLDQAIEQANPDGSSPRAIVTGLGDLKLMAVTPPPAALAFIPSPFDFGQVGTGQTSSPQTFTLANTGGQATGALTDTLTGAAAFTVTGDTCTGTSLVAGGTCTVAVRFAPASIATDTARLTGVSANPAVTATAPLTGTGVRPRFLYWTDQIGTASGTVSVIPLTGVGTPTTLVTGQASPAGVAVDASHIYWADSGSGTVSERSLTGGITIALYVSTFAAPSGVAFDSGHVYWANSGNGTINETS